MDKTYSVDYIFLDFCDILPWGHFSGSSWLERETRIHESPMPVPLGQLLSLQAREEEKAFL
jgi:hypothetical protein